MHLIFFFVQDEEKKRQEEREKRELERRYTLPDHPSIVVHPSPTAKSGKFDCALTSLSVLLDYRIEDNKEHSFEVSLNWSVARYRSRIGDNDEGKLSKSEIILSQE